MNKFSKGDHLVSFVTIGHLIAMMFGEDVVAKNSFDQSDVVKKQFWRTDQFCGVAEDKDKADREEQGRHHLWIFVVNF